MLQEPFAHGSSPIHTIDPRFKIVMATFYAFAVALSNRFPALFLSLAFSSVLIGVSRLPIMDVAKRVALVNGFVLFFWLVVPLTYPGEPLFSLGPLTATREGVMVAAQITLKSNAILLAFIALIATSSVATLGAALSRLGVPQKMVHLMLLNYRASCKINPLIQHVGIFLHQDHSILYAQHDFARGSTDISLSWKKNIIDWSGPP